MNNIRTILSLSAQEAQDYLLNEENYSNFDLPDYFTFRGVLDKIKKRLNGRNISGFYKQDANGKPLKPKDCEDVNYKIIANKDGLYAWRPFQLIHPALYVELVNAITSDTNWPTITARFKEFQQNPKIQCASIPVVSTEAKKTQKSKQILAWWRDVEQTSLAKTLDFSYLYTTDITDCYGSIYTHSISWALHKRSEIKTENKRNDKTLIGNKIDEMMRDMSNAQTNGIPQGSVLMDFIAEMVLGYADLKLSEKLGDEDINIRDYHIIRYRDDYRIFVNNQTDGDLITKCLTEVLIELGLKLNPSKTSSTNNLILGSIKRDKLNLTTSILGERYLKIYDTNEDYEKEGGKKIKTSTQKLLLQIYDFADKHPNSGQLKRILSTFYEKLNIDCKRDNLPVLVSIVVDLAYNNPSVYHLCSAIISKILDCMETDEKKLDFISRINKKFKNLPNTGFMDIWLQRISYKISPDIEYVDKLCKIVKDKIVKDKNLPLWNSDWLDDKFKKEIEDCSLINIKKLENMTPVITQKEVDAFQPQYDDFD